jgi:hypothetical protein
MLKNINSLCNPVYRGSRKHISNLCNPRSHKRTCVVVQSAVPIYPVFTTTSYSDTSAKENHSFRNQIR